ncbi:hypothetical protein K0038_02994 [Pseudomonas syringae]|nr:hypothetical protein [Pseudomonas syringae]
MDSACYQSLNTTQASSQTLSDFTALFFQLNQAHVFGLILIATCQQKMIDVDDRGRCLILPGEGEGQASQRDWFYRCLSGIGTGLMDSDVSFSRHQMGNSMLAITTLAWTHAAAAGEFYAVD